MLFFFFFPVVCFKTILLHSKKQYANDLGRNNKENNVLQSFLLSLFVVQQHVPDCWKRTTNNETVIHKIRCKAEKDSSRNVGVC